ncbi:MAG TPA: DUF1697 domain-containing protein [Candidatus Saccharimonadia bacterium]|jgi:uncharacterized protein (DUF1697 family)
MKTYIILIRGINVGGKNIVPMAGLKTCLEEELGFAHISTYIASGNVILQSEHSADKVKAQIESALPRAFRLDSKLIKVLVLTLDQLQAIVDRRPAGFGADPALFRSDVIFLIDLNVGQALAVCSPREGVDQVWPGDGVLYFQRLDARRTQSRMSKIVGTPAYRSMTIRTWSTTTKLLELVKSVSTK